MVKNIKNNNQKAFSLVEVLVSMLILSLFFLANTKVMTTKQKDETLMKVHGFYECYWDGGVLKYAQSKTGRSVEPQIAGDACVFSPDRNTSLFDMTVIFADNKGVFYNDEFVNVETMSIIPPSMGSNVVSYHTPSKAENYSPDFATENVTYDMIINNLKLTSKNSNILQLQTLPGGPGANGAVIINW